MKDQFGNDENMNSEPNKLDKERPENDRSKQDKENYEVTDNDHMSRNTNRKNIDTDPMGEDRINRSQNESCHPNSEGEVKGKDPYSETGPFNNGRDRERSDRDEVIVGMFETENETINVVKRLQEIGYHEDEITVVAKDKDQMGYLDDTTDTNTKTQAGAEKIGAGRPSGPIVGMGGGVAGGVAGGLAGGLVALGVREEDAREYEHQIEQGKILILVKNRENLRDDVNTAFRQNKSFIADGNLRR